MRKFTMGTTSGPTEDAVLNVVNHGVEYRGAQANTDPLDGDDRRGGDPFGCRGGWSGAGCGRWASAGAGGAAGHR